MLFGATNVRAMQTAAEVCRALVGTQGRLFDGWPTGRVFSEDYDAGRVQRVRDAAPGRLGADISDEILFDVCSDIAARRRHARYTRYAVRVARAMRG